VQAFRPARTVLSGWREWAGRKLLRREHARRRGKSLRRGLSVVPAGLSISADLRRSLALANRFPDWRSRPAVRYRSLAQRFPACPATATSEVVGKVHNIETETQ